MTTWKYKVEPIYPENGITSIELDRDGIVLICMNPGLPMAFRNILIANNELQLLFFAQQLISLINETHPEWFLKNHVVVSAKAVKEFRNES